MRFPLDHLRSSIISSTSVQCYQINHLKECTNRGKWKPIALYWNSALICPDEVGNEMHCKDNEEMILVTGLMNPRNKSTGILFCWNIQVDSDPDGIVDEWLKLNPQVRWSPDCIMSMVVSHVFHFYFFFTDEKGKCGPCWSWSISSSNTTGYQKINKSHRVNDLSSLGLKIFWLELKII